MRLLPRLPFNFIPIPSPIVSCVLYSFTVGYIHSTTFSRWRPQLQIAVLLFFFAQFSSQARKNDKLCTKNEDICIKNEEFCIKNDEFIYYHRRTSYRTYSAQHPHLINPHQFTTVFGSII